MTTALRRLNPFSSEFVDVHVAHAPEERAAPNDAPGCAPASRPP
ncbi:MAG: hypothetical protein ACRDHE_01750 [Ktedonobacterales bacterium]